MNQYYGAYEFVKDILENIDDKAKVRDLLEKYGHYLNNNEYIAIKIIKKYPEFIDFIIDKLYSVELQTISRWVGFLPEYKLLKLAAKCKQVREVCSVLPGEVLSNIKTYLVLDSNKNKIS